MKLLILSIAVFLWAVPAHGADVGPVELTLDEALRAAFENNARLRAARQAIESTAGRAEQVRAWPNPEVAFIAEEVPREGSLGDGKNLLGVSQTVPFPFKKIFERRAGRSQVESVRREYDLTAISLEREAKVAFYRVLAAEQSLAISSELTATARGFAEAARRRVEAGAAPLQESLRAEIELERARSDSIAGEREQELAHENLFLLMGEPRRAVKLVGALSADTTIVASVSTEAVHPLVAAAAARVDGADHELKRAKIDLLPDLDLRFAAGRDAVDDGVMEVEAAISIPLFNFGGGLRREKRAELETARAELLAAERDLESGRRAASRTFRAAAEQATAYRDRIIPRAEQALDLVRRGFEAGKFGFIDVLDTQRTLAEARLAYVETLFELNSARADWEAFDTSTSPVEYKE